VTGRVSGHVQHLEDLAEQLGAVAFAQRHHGHRHRFIGRTPDLRALGQQGHQFPQTADMIAMVVGH